MGGNYFVQILKNSFFALSKAHDSLDLGVLCIAYDENRRVFFFVCHNFVDL